MHGTLRGKRYRFVSKRLPKADGGQCEHPMLPGKEIRVDRGCRSPKIMLEYLIHEMLHACFWDMDEEAIEEAGHDIAKMLTRLGIALDVNEVHDRLKEQRSQMRKSSTSSSSDSSSSS